jgi:misacylated tRNA(Ala) deacylase
MSVQPPRGSGRVRLVEDARASTCNPAAAPTWPTPHEIGAVVVTKIEKKSAATRRVVLGFESTP